MLYPDAASQMLNRGEEALELLAGLLPVPASIQLAPTSTLWLTFTLSTRTPKPFSAGLLHSWWVPSLCGCLG